MERVDDKIRKVIEGIEKLNYNMLSDQRPIILKKLDEKIKNFTGTEEELLEYLKTIKDGLEIILILYPIVRFNA